ncbi:MAG: Crp/Fnr family transcriptional regulator [Pseudomonadota bacterium]|nr:Crp/Fnr family transcriptional regulator [Pseudomonadota bacterium]
MSLAQSNIGNILLHTMAPGDFRRLESHLQRIDLPVRLQLHEAGCKIEHVYFPEDGIVSIVAVTLDGKQCEVGLFGREGMSETATVMGTDHSPHEAYVQAKGISALKLPTAVLAEAMAKSPTMRLHLLKYVQAMVIQLSTSIAAAGQTIEQRLARWLLMCHDRVEDNILPLTHEFIGMMLGVRRAGVTEALLKLNSRQLITTERGSITVDDRPGLERLAAGGYGLAEAEYARLVGVALRRDPHDPQRAMIQGCAATG